MPDKIRDNEIVKALECCMNGHCDDDCPFRETREHCHSLDSLILDLINRQKAEIEELKLKNSNLTSNLSSLKNDLSSAEAENERLKKSNRNWRRKVQRLRADNNELIYKLECLLCHSTGGKLSKHNYPLDTMECYVNDTIQEYCEEAEKEAKAEAYKEFAERLKNEINVRTTFSKEQDKNVLIYINNLLKELVGDENG